MRLRDKVLEVTGRPAASAKLCAGGSPRMRHLRDRLGNAP
jgi:hypothetical protein